MTDIIDELAHLAVMHAKNHVEDCKQYGYYMEHNEFEIRFRRMFAHLIINECIGLLPKECHSGGDCKVENVLKSHFGIHD